MIEGESASRERILSACERLFIERGYRGVRLKNIADAVGIRQASLYYHFPDGKQELYVEVMRRSFRLKRTELEKHIEAGGQFWKDRLLSAAEWMLGESLYDYRRMVQSDLPEIGEAEAESLVRQAYESLHAPVERVFALGREQEGLQLPMPGMISGTFIAILEGVQVVPPQALPDGRLAAVHQVIDILVEGLRPRD